MLIGICYNWAGSPNEFNDGNNANEFNVNDDGNLDWNNVNENNGVRGVFSLQFEYYYTKQSFMNVITL